MKNFYYKAGFSTLELLIAFAVITLSMTAVIMVAFGSQSNAVDTELAQRALYLTQTNLENAGVALKNNFDALLTPTTTALFGAELAVTDISECAKRVDSESFWNRDMRALSNSLSSVFIDVAKSDALDGDCATEEPSDDWDNPDTFVSEDFGGAGATSIDERDHQLFITANPGNSNNKPELYIYDFDEEDIELDLVAELDLGTDNNGAGTKFGLYDVEATENFAFAASASRAGQLQVINISNPAVPVLQHAVLLPGVDVVTGSYPEARKLYYYNKRLYVGTNETEGPEFHIFDVSGDLTLNPPAHLGSLELTHNVEDIVVRDNYAYLATSDDNHELMVIDISNPGSLEHPDDTDLGYNATGNQDGSAVFVTGDKVYLGRKQDNPKRDEFFILNRSLIIDDTETDDGLIASHSLDLANNSYVAGIRISGRFAFLALDDATTGLIIYNITDPLNIFLPASCSEYNFAENSSDIDNDSNSRYMFVTSESNADIRVIYNDNANSCDA